jgi:hypothetical protein
MTERHSAPTNARGWGDSPRRRLPSARVRCECWPIGLRRLAKWVEAAGLTHGM